jgi:hypothetical protein
MATLLGCIHARDVPGAREAVSSLRAIFEATCPRSRGARAAAAAPAPGAPPRSLTGRELGALLLASSAYFPDAAFGDDVPFSAGALLLEVLDAPHTRAQVAEDVKANPCVRDCNGPIAPTLPPPR